jgi:hypothetical protein
MLRGQGFARRLRPSCIHDQWLRIAHCCRLVLQLRLNNVVVKGITRVRSALLFPKGKGGSSVLSDRAGRGSSAFMHRVPTRSPANAPGSQQPLFRLEDVDRCYYGYVAA